MELQPTSSVDLGKNESRKHNSLQEISESADTKTVYGHIVMYLANLKHVRALSLHGWFSSLRCSVEAPCCLYMKQHISRYTIPLNKCEAQFLRNGEFRNFVTGNMH